MKNKPLYISRPVMMGWELVSWACKNGFKNVLHEHDLHVTTIMSREAIEWPQPLQNFITIEKPNFVLKQFDNGAAALTFECAELDERWIELREMGASWDYPDYTPHVSISYNSPLPENYTPFDGFLILGPETIEPYIESWRPKNVVAND